MKTKTPKDLNLAEWQEFIEEISFLDNPLSFMNDGKPLAMRIENTSLTIARHFGGCTYNEAHYVYFEPVIPGKLNDKGKPYIAWIVVRDEFLKYVAERLKKAQMKKGDEPCLL